MHSTVTFDAELKEIFIVQFIKIARRLSRHGSHSKVISKIKDFLRTF